MLADVCMCEGASYCHSALRDICSPSFASASDGLAGLFEALDELCLLPCMRQPTCFEHGSKLYHSLGSEVLILLSRCSHAGRSFLRRRSRHRRVRISFREGSLCTRHILVRKVASESRGLGRVQEFKNTGIQGREEKGLIKLN
jgi:hypothetical protein